MTTTITKPGKGTSMEHKIDFGRPRKRTWRDFPSGGPHEDDYATEVNRIRVILDEQGDDYPWLVDGIQVIGGTLLYTEECGRYANLDDALTLGVPELMDALERTPWVRVNITAALVEEDLITVVAA
jgi:hypothetical protein